MENIKFPIYAICASLAISTGLGFHSLYNSKVHSGSSIEVATFMVLAALPYISWLFADLLGKIYTFKCLICALVRTWLCIAMIGLALFYGTAAELDGFPLVISSIIYAVMTVMSLLNLLPANRNISRAV